MSALGRNNRLPLLRFLLAWSALSPAFIIWAIRGTTLVDNYLWILFCIELFIFPNTLLLLFLWKQSRKKDSKTITPNRIDNKKELVIAYLIAILLPFYQANITSWRELGGSIFALIIIVYLFWQTNLIHLNILFSIINCNILLLTGDDGRGGEQSFIYLTRNDRVPLDKPLTAIRVTSSILIDEELLIRKPR
jgi:hypothetical protein